MPWRGANYPGEFPSLGYVVADYIEERCVIPDGPHEGEPFLLTDEMLRFVVWHYRLWPLAYADVDKPSKAFTVRRSQLVRPQKWGKGPLSAAIICAEADDVEGPVLFDGWDADGEPVGRPWPTPWIQLTALSEDQTANVWRALLPMIGLGPLADTFIDTGQTRINTPRGGLIEPVTSSGGSRLGQRITFALQDETHSWLKTNGMHKVATTQRRNLSGTGGRSIETTNGWDPAEQSTAQITHRTALADVYIDFPAPIEGKFANKRDRKRIIAHAYGDSWWVDQERINADAEELIAEGKLSEAARFFGNLIEVSEESWIDPVTFELRADRTIKVDRREKITLGFDGGRFEDSTGLYACRGHDGFLWVPEFEGKWAVWEKPDGPAGEGWEVPGDEVDAFVDRLFTLFRVVLMYCDPPYWQDNVAGWASRYGTERVKEWWTQRERAMVAALERIHTAIATGKSADGHPFVHDGNPVAAQHFANARRRIVRSGLTIGKDRPGSPNKIDLSICATLAYEARADAFAAGKLRKRGSGGGE